MRDKTKGGRDVVAVTVNHVPFMPDGEVEPMTRHADALHAADPGGLAALDFGGSLAGQVTFQPHDHAPPFGTAG
jgi:hypothetical protein